MHSTQFLGLSKLFESLLAIEGSAELRLTILILAKAVRSGEDCPAVNYAEFHSLTDFSPTTIAKGLNGMQARGYILRHAGKGKQATRYQVLWDNLGIRPDTGSSADSLSHTTRFSKAATAAESYFTSTGFLDLLPQATDIARSLGYGEAEMIEAVCMVFDKQRTDPPTRNRMAWFTTVFREKIHEAHAQIRAHRERENNVVYSQSTGIPG